MFDSELTDLAKSVLKQFEERGLTLTTAESCTGGLITGVLTAIAGSSSVVERGFVTYTNEAKMEMLGVTPALFPDVGAVSSEVAREMAAGAVAHSRADIAVAVTGVAGPGQSERKPAGLVYIGSCKRGGEPIALEFRFSGDRNAVRRQAVIEALSLAVRVLDSA
ncbi:CinA family protein [Hwanghaeella grinnelliae]|uniref:CinA family protein n=1 Tax=Hwanghaeella grinnelliae TaxID=2500179 RepID=A0A437QY13_9PROT|nr:CinA family protein [Hwanghaeella grinnelliae]RVU39359.1 CinA family protein [Hwanghaeella grinnelliae]